MLAGTGFVSGAIAAFPPAQGVSVSRDDFVSSAELQLTLSVAATAPVRLDTVTVTNPDTGKASCTCFTVTASGVTVTGIAPGAIGAGGTRMVTVTGSGFVAGAMVSISGMGVGADPPSVQDSSTLTVRIAAPHGYQYFPGPRDVTVTDSAGSGTCAGCMTLDPAPNPTSGSPNTLPRGTTNATVILNGTDFVSGAVASSPNETGIVDVTSTVFVSSTQLQLTVTVASNAPTGAYDIKVVNPDTGFRRRSLLIVT
jgi:hypothetical protein